MNEAMSVFLEKRNIKKQSLMATPAHQRYLDVRYMSDSTLRNSQTVFRGCVSKGMEKQRRPCSAAVFFARFFQKKNVLAHCVQKFSGLISLEEDSDSLRPIFEVWVDGRRAYGDSADSAPEYQCDDVIPSPKLSVTAWGNMVCPCVPPSSNGMWSCRCCACTISAQTADKI